MLHTSESILMSKYVAESINQTTDCRTFWPRRLSSAAYKQAFVTKSLAAWVVKENRQTGVHAGRTTLCVC